MKKRGLSLFLALALCLTLLPAAAFANGEPETSTLHTHYLCGNAEACSYVGDHNETDKTIFATAIRQDDNGKVWVGGEPEELPYQCVLSNGGTYYLDSNLVLKGPSALNKVGCIYIDSDVTLCLNGHTITIIDDRDAFDIRKSMESDPPTLTLTDCKNSGQITHGTTAGGVKYLGNGVSLHQSCDFIMYGGSITGNTTTGGENTTWRSGGVWVRDNSTFTMYGGSITNNTTVWNGGGVYVGGSGKFYMHGGEISGNSASSNSGSSGGGVHIGGDSTFTMTGGTISGNSASNNGGGVHIGSDSTFTMTGGSITGNNAGNGGGVYVGSDVGYGNSILTLSGAVQIKDNVCNGTKGSNGNYSGGTTSNVYLRSGKTITIGTNHLSSNASIGVTTQNLPTNEGIAIATGANLNDKQYFHSDTGENYLFYVTSDGTICMTTANAHDHPICGASCSHNGSSHTNETWQPIGSAEELTAIQNGGYYYLADDVTLSSRSVWEPPSDTFLCLNGHTITGAAGTSTIAVGNGVNFILTDCKGSGKITHESSDAVGCGVNVIGSFIMYGGSITGNHNSDGGGVWVENTGSFTMYGGSITGNSVSGSGGGVFVAAYDGTQGSFAMYGGSITGNNVSGFVGSGGVCVYGTMTVSGSVRITENVKGGSKDDSGIYTGGTASNVCLIGRTTITIDGPLTEVSQIGVTLYSNRVFTSGWSTNMRDKPFSSYFIADDSSSTVALEDGELKLSNPHTHSWTYALSTTTTGSATITATCKNCTENNNTDFHGGSVTIAAPEADALTYDSSPKAAAVTTSGDWLGASADNIRITYKQGETTLPSAPTDAGTYTAGITVGEGEGAVTASVEYTIAPKELADPTIEIASGSVYDGNAKTPNATVKDGENTIAPSEYTVSYDNNVSAGENTATVTITDNANGNYTVSGSAKFSIAKADSACTAPTPITALTYTGEAQPLISAGFATDGTMMYSLRKDGDYSETIPTGENAGEYTVWYKVAGDGNHSDTTPASVSVTIAKAKVEIPAADPTQFTYSGGDRTYTLAASGLYTVGGNVRKSAGTYTVTVTLEDTANYVWSNNTDAAKTFDFVIAKAPVTVTVKDKSVYVGSTAPDLSKPELDKDYTVSGLIGEDKLTTAPMLKYTAAPDMNKTGETKIFAEGAEAGENYEITYVDGKLTVTSRPSSGGGGSSSSGGGGGSSSSDKLSASTCKTETTTNPDGSVTKTETKSDGTVTETTTNKDGSTTKTETKPDGSSKTEVKDASGSTGTVKTDKNGQTTAETTLGSKAVEDAKKNGEAVKAPVEVEASRDSNTAPTVKVELPKNAGETEVEIPVSNVKPGTVAVLVHPDGTEEIVKNSLPTEDSIRLTMDGSATVKIMDNSKDFIDTRAHWAKDAIDFVSARGLVNGISDTIYAPNNSTTRAQLWTILSRQNDADLTGGSSWYEKAQNWAKDKGVSDGANPNGIINRAQIVTMLWRAIGQPAAASGASFADVPADSYYAQAVAWAIENGITAGVGNGTFDPDAACTRGQIATFLYRYMK